MQDPTVIQESYYILSERDGSWVEAWTAQHLSHCKPAQSSYRECLGNAIRGLGPADGVRATYISDIVKRNLDVENVLIYNVGEDRFGKVATRTLRFHRINASPPPSPRLLAFKSCHYVRYRVTRRNTFKDVEGTKLAHCEPVVFGDGELRYTKKGCRDYGGRSKTLS